MKKSKILAIIVIIAVLISGICLNEKVFAADINNEEIDQEQREDNVSDEQGEIQENNENNQLENLEEENPENNRRGYTSTYK